MTLSDSDIELLEAACELSREKLGQHGSMPSHGIDPYAVVIMISSAQGAIDNGGLKYFFEGDWPDTPPYEFFVEQYRLIGAATTADAITTATKSFGFEAPHVHLEKREEFLERHSSDSSDEGPFGELDDVIYDDEVWEKLVAYIKANRSLFGL